MFYSVVCRVATILKTRYAASGFRLAGLRLFEQAECLVSDPSQKQHLKNCISEAKEHLHEIDNAPEVLESVNNSLNRGYLFEGHLTVDPEPSQPQWLVQANLMNAVASLMTAESSWGPVENNNTSETAANLFQDLINNLDVVIPEILENDDAPLELHLPVKKSL